MSVIGKELTSGRPQFSLTHLKRVLCQHSVRAVKTEELKKLEFIQKWRSVAQARAVLFKTSLDDRFGLRRNL
jgi:hypothetical protein